MPVPYETAFREINLKLSTYKFDNSEVGHFKSSKRRYSLRKWSDSGWSEVTIEGTVELPSTTPKLFHPDNRTNPPGKLLLAIDCPDSHHRYGKPIKTEKIESGSYAFKETIDRGYAYGDVQIRPILVRTSDGDDRRYAQFPYMRIADGQPVKISFDDVEKEGSNLMDVHFESFEKSALPDNNLYHLDRVDESGPEIWVNEDYVLIARVLDSEANSGWAANMQSALATWIAKDVITELVQWAIVGAADGKFDAQWQESLLEDYGPRIYEYTDAESPSELHDHLMGENGDDPHYLVNTIEKVVQNQVRVTTPVEEFIEREASEYFLRKD